MSNRRVAVSVQRARTLARVFGATLGMVSGVLYGLLILSQSHLFQHNVSRALASLLAVGVAMSATFALAAPIVTVNAFLWLRDAIDHATAGELLGGSVGIIIALAVSALLAALIGGLPYGIGFVISLVMAGVLVYVGVRAGTRRRGVVDDLLAGLPRGARVADAASEPAEQDGAPIVVDTSALIDGRIVDVARTGFIQGRLLLADCVLEELQKVADSADPVRRQRGRRGLGLADELRRTSGVVCELVEASFPGTPDVDVRLIKLARTRGAALLTVDYNLNKLAQAEGLRVLNLNDLAAAVKPPAMAGDALTVAIVKEGREPRQGIGYLADGTMIVVEGGRDHLESTIEVTVTSVLQTSSGRMIFAGLGGRPGAAERADHEGRRDDAGHV